MLRGLLRPLLQRSTDAAASYTPSQGGGYVWDGNTVFFAAKGFNVGEPLGYEHFNPWTTGYSFESYMTPAVFAGITIQTLADHIRIQMDPTSMLRAVGDSAKIGAALVTAKNAIDLCIASGLKVIVNMQVSFVDAQFSDALLRAGYTANNATWTKMKAAWLEFAKLCRPYPTSQVAFELYNETQEETGAVYLPMLAALRDYLRAQLGYKTTFLLGPPFFVDHQGWQATLWQTFALDQNEAYVYHHYEPHAFTHQGLIGTGIEQYFSRIPFPAVETDRSPAISRATNAINADGTLSSGQKTTAISTATTALNDYYDNYDNVVGSQWDGTKFVDEIPRWTAIFGSFNPSGPYGGGDYAGNSVEKWRQDHAIPNSRILVTEMGAHRDYEVIGASNADIAAYFAYAKRYLDVRGWGYAVYDVGFKHFSIRSDTDAGATFTPNGDFVPSVLVALGMKNPSWVPAGRAWTPDDLGAKLVYSGTDPSAVTAADATQGMFAVVTPTAINGDRTILGASASGGRQYRINAGATPSIMRQGVAARAQGVTSTTTLAIGVTSVVGGLSKSAAPLGRFWIRGQEVALNFGTAGTFTAATTTVKGSQGGGGEPFAGTVGRVVITTGSLTDDEIDRITGWLAWQDSSAGVASLIAGHPYKASAPVVTE